MTTGTQGREEGRDTLKVLLLVLAWLACTAWMRPLMTPDEGRYVGVAWEMLRSGDWLTPTLNGLPFFHKPPLFYWLAGAALALAGSVEIAGRVPALLGATLGALSLYVFTRHWCGRPLARRVLWVLLAQPLFFVGAQFANLDMLVAGCITATVLALAHAALRLEAHQDHRGALLLGYALAGMGLLAKGLIGLVIPALVLGLWLAVRRRWATAWALVSLAGMLVLLLVAAPWFVAMQSRFADFGHYFFLVQHFRRYAGGGFNNAMPLWFYPVLVAVCSMPCLLWGVAALRRTGTAGQTEPHAAVRWLMVLAVVAVVGFFSLPKSKLVGYILPAVPPLAWWMADASQVLVTTRWRRHLWRASVAVSGLLGLAVVLAIAHDGRHTTRLLGLALGAQHVQGQSVYMLEDYFYDVPFYAHLGEPVRVVADWRAPGERLRDDWRKELADAARFDDSMARRVLLRPAQLPAALACAPVSWVMARTSVRERYPVLARAQEVYSVQGRSLWRVQSADGLSAADCAGMPNGG